jgi:hypothetical protein
VVGRDDRRPPEHRLAIGEPARPIEPADRPSGAAHAAEAIGVQRLVAGEIAGVLGRQPAIDERLRRGQLVGGGRPRRERRRGRSRRDQRPHRRVCRRRVAPSGGRGAPAPPACRTRRLDRDHQRPLHRAIMLRLRA